VTAPTQPRAGRRAAQRGDVTLLELLDRLLEGGVAIKGDITLAVADIDLVDVSLQLVLGAVESVGRDLRGPLARAERPVIEA
jgi:hypothetical protein